VRDHPLGAGGRAFHILSPRYVPEVIARNAAVEERSSHNTYVQLGTEWGVQGIVLWLAFIAATLVLLHRVRRITPQNDWYFYRSLAIEVGLIGTLTAAFFSNRLYGESIYWLCALAFALYRMQATELAGLSAKPAVESSEASDTFGHAAARAQEAPAR
jgi:O-antigen ligase